MISRISTVRWINSWVRTIPKSLSMAHNRQEEEDTVGLLVTILDFLLFNIFKCLEEDIGIRIKFSDK